MKEIQFFTRKKIDLDRIRILYEDAGWSSYSRDFECLAKGIDQSLMVISAWNQGELVGLVRVIVAMGSRSSIFKTFWFGKSIEEKALVHNWCG